MAAETGLPGLVAFVFIIALCIKWCLAAPPSRCGHAWTFAVGLLVYAFQLNSQPVIYSQWLFPVLWLLLGGMIAATADN